MLKAELSRQPQRLVARGAAWEIAVCLCQQEEKLYKRDLLAMYLHVRADGTTKHIPSNLTLTLTLII